MILIESAADIAHNHKVGDKVKALYSDGHYYPGTVEKIGPNTVTIRWDDGDYLQRYHHTKIKAIPQKKPSKFKRPKETIETEDDWEDVPTTPAVTTPIQVQVPSGPTPPSPLETDESIFQSYYQIAQKSTDLKKLAYIKGLWYANNVNYFESKLKDVKIEWLGDQSPDAFNNRGLWSARRQTIYLSKRIMNAPFDVLQATLKHEMAHQAVNQISKLTYQEPNKGHGPVWRSWMIKIGEPPNQFDNESNKTYMDDKERNSAQSKEDAYYAAIANRHRISVADLRVGLPVTYYRPEERTLVPGVLAGKYDKDSWAVVIDFAPGASFMIVGQNSFFDMDEQHAAVYLTPQWQNAAEYLAQHLIIRRNQKRLKRR